MCRHTLVFMSETFPTSCLNKRFSAIKKYKMSEMTKRQFSCLSGYQYFRYVQYNYIPYYSLLYSFLLHSRRLFISLFLGVGMGWLP